MKSIPILLVFLIALLSVSTACSNSYPAANMRIITEEFPPFNFTDQDNHITGQSTEIVREILKRTGSQATIEMMPWSQGYDLVQKEPHSILYSTSRITERENLFKWVGPIGSEDNYFYTRQNSEIKVSNLEEAKKFRAIAVYRNDSNHLYLASQGFTNLDINENDGECLKKLIDGKVDIWLGPAKALDFIAYKAQLNPTAVKPVMYVRKIEWFIAFSKTVPDTVVNLWQSKLTEIKQKDTSGSSFYERIIDSYTTPQYVEDSVSPEVVVQLVEQAAGKITQDAQDTFKHINNREHPYLDRDNSDLYVFVFDTALNQIANADNPANVGYNLMGVPDITGQLFRDRILERSLSEGAGWENYVFTIPGRIGIFYKSAYFKLVIGSDGKQYIVCAGRYIERPGY